jgi:hypothetical protein
MKLIGLLTGLIVAGCVVLSAIPAQAAVLFQDDFTGDEYTPVHGANWGGGGPDSNSYLTGLGTAIIGTVSGYGTNTNLTFDNSTEPLSFVFRARFGSSTDASIGSMYGDQTTNNPPRVQINGAWGTLQGEIHDGGANDNWFGYPGQTWTDWHVYGLVIGQGIQEIYIDGVLKSHKEYALSGTALNRGTMTGKPSNMIEVDYFKIMSGAVPEPSTVLLVGSGILGLAGAAWRKRA